MNKPEHLSISKETLEKAIQVFEETCQKKLMIKINFQTNIEQELLLLNWLEKFSNLEKEKPYFEYIHVYAGKRVFLSGDIKATNENTRFSFGYSITQQSKRANFPSLNYLFGFFFKQFRSEIPDFEFEETFQTVEEVIEVQGVETVETEEFTDSKNQVNLKMNKITKYLLVASLVFILICVMKWYRII